MSDIGGATGIRGNDGQVLGFLNGVLQAVTLTAGAPSGAFYLLTAANASLPNGVVVSAYPFVNADIAAAAAIAVSKLAAGASPGQVLQTVGGVPTWSTPTFPTGSPAAGDFLIGDGTNYILAPYDLPTAIGTNGQVMQSNGTDVVFATIAATASKSWWGVVCAVALSTAGTTQYLPPTGYLESVTILTT